MILSLRKVGENRENPIFTFVNHPRKSLRLGADMTSVGFDFVWNPALHGGMPPIANKHHMRVEMLWGPLSEEDGTDFQKWWQEPV